MFSFLFYGVGLASLLWVSIQDWRTEKFNAVISFTALLVMAAVFQKPESMTGLALTTIASGIGVYKEYIRPGDMLPVAVYGLAFPQLQSMFTLLTVTGLYLYSYPKIRGETEWIPYLPAILISYLVQLLLF